MKSSSNDFNRNSSLNYALNILSKRNITTVKLRQKMVKKGFPEEEITETVNKLIEWKYLDDYSYAVSYVKAKNQKYSRSKIFYELLNLGIAKDLVTDVLEDFYNEEREYTNCLELAYKIWNAEGEKWKEKYQKNRFGYRFYSRRTYLEKKLADKLLAKGFPPNIVRSVLSRVLIEEDF